MAKDTETEVQIIVTNKVVECVDVGDNNKLLVIKTNGDVLYSSADKSKGMFSIDIER